MEGLSNLRVGERIRNWTIHSGYIGDDFEIHKVGDAYVEVQSPGAETIQHIPLADFAKVGHVWEGYVSGKLQRHVIRDKTRFSKYIISILHHVKHGKS